MKICLPQACAGPEHILRGARGGLKSNVFLWTLPLPHSLLQDAVPSPRGVGLVSPQLVPHQAQDSALATQGCLTSTCHTVSAATEYQAGRAIRQAQAQDWPGSGGEEMGVSAKQGSAPNFCTTKDCIPEPRESCAQDLRSPGWLRIPPRTGAKVSHSWNRY